MLIQHVLLILLGLLLLCVGILVGLITARRRSPKSDSTFTNQQPIAPLEPSQSSAEVSLLPGSIVIQGGEEMLMTFEPANPSPDAYSLPNHIAEWFSTLLGQIPAGALALNTLDTYRVVFNPAITRGLSKEALRIVQSQEAQGIRLLASDGNGRIVGHGTAVSSSTLLPVGLLLFQTVSFVTGQIHMSRITKRLDRIENKLNTLLTRLDEAEIGKMRANAGHLQNIAHAIETGRLTPNDIDIFDHQIENVEHRMMELQETIWLALKRQHESLRWASLPKADGGTKAIRDIVEHYDRTADKLETALNVRVMALYMKAMLPVGYEIVKHRKADIERDLLQYYEALGDSRKVGHRRAKNIKGGWFTEEKAKKSRTDAQEAVSDVINPRRRSFGRLRKHVAAVDDVLLRRRVMASDLSLELTRGKDGKWHAAALPISE